MQKVVLLAALFAVVHGKYFSRCNLIYELRRQGFPDEKLWDWVCLIENESGGATYAKGLNKNGSHDYGLFQINDQFWCSNTTIPGKDCNVTCDQLMTDDITVACQCAMKIYNRHSFMAWYGWRDNCKDKPSMDANRMILQCYG